MKLLRIICITLIVICGLITLSYADNNQMIICYDTNLYNVLCNYFGESLIVKKDDEKLIIEVTKETMDSVTELDLSNKGITDIKGLEVFDKVNTLKLSNNNISNLSPIRDLTGIQYLYLNNNNISDLSLLVTSLEDAEVALNILDLSNNKIADITMLSNFNNLITLNLSGNQISNIDSVAGLENLQDLYLGSNNITDITPVSTKESLKNLNLENNKITKIESLETKNLESLNLKNNRLTDIEFLKTLNSLKGLDLSNNQIVKIPEFCANWINNKKIADLKLDSQKINIVIQDKEINLGKNSSYTNLLYFGYFFKDDLKITSENGKLDSEKLIFTVEDFNKTAKLTIDDGVFKNSNITINYGGSQEIETAPNDVEVGTNTNTENSTTNNTDDKVENDVPNSNKNDNNAENTLKNDDSTTASGKMPYTGIASKVIVIITFISVVLIGIYTFSKNKK